MASYCSCSEAVLTCF